MSEIYALDLDEDFLSHLVDPEAWLVIGTEQIDEAIIQDEEIRNIFRWQREHLREHGKPATTMVLAEEFDLDLTPPETAIGDLLDRMRDRYAKNQGRKTLEFIIREQREDPLAIPQLLLKKGRELNEVLARRGDMFTLEDHKRARNRYNKKVLAGRGASTGFAELDEYFFGMSGVNMYLAPRKTFKSMIMCRAAIQNVLEGRNTWLYGLELPSEETDMRIRCMAANIPWWHYIRNCITDDEWVRINDCADALTTCGLLHVVKPLAGHRGIEEMVYQARDGGGEVVFVDQLQYVESSNGRSIGSQNDTGVYWEVLNAARDLSDDGPICFAHQFNREARWATEMPPVENAKGSASIEEVCALVLGLWADGDMRKSGKVEVGTLIARHHEYASWLMSFDLKTGCRFEIDGRIFDDDRKGATKE